MYAAQQTLCSGNNKIACQITRGRVDAEEVAPNNRLRLSASLSVVAQFLSRKAGQAHQIVAEVLHT